MVRRSAPLKPTVQFMVQGERMTDDMKNTTTNITTTADRSKEESELTELKITELKITEPNPGWKETWPDICVCCGKPVPEGRMICWCCEHEFDETKMNAFMP
ncbi:MAG: hypothetical protein LUI87_10425 [Lachnospiraceae bacterium]|nr:hypothetical protein [Lachnospiraceae bacterium]